MYLFISKGTYMLQDDHELLNHGIKHRGYLHLHNDHHMKHIPIPLKALGKLG